MPPTSDFADDANCNPFPDEIMIDQCYHRHWKEKEEDSVVGDRDTDVELVPVYTQRSHDWTELGVDPIMDIPRTESAYLNNEYSEAITDFVKISDEKE